MTNWIERPDSEGDWIVCRSESKPERYATSSPGRGWIGRVFKDTGTDRLLIANGFSTVNVNDASFNGCKFLKVEWP